MTQIDLHKLHDASLELRRLQGTLPIGIDDKIIEVHELLDDLIVRLILYMNPEKQ